MVKQVSEKGLQWFQDARFGMFIHWGLYSLIGRGEWVMHWEKIPVPEYEKLRNTVQPRPISTLMNGSSWQRMPGRNIWSSPAATMTASACMTPP